MISQFTVQNFGLIDRISIDFCKGLNIFTGETGAGKSLVIDALQFALGKRINSSQIRDPEKNCIVELILDLTKNEIINLKCLAEYISDKKDEIIITRIHFPDGRNKNKINGFTITTSQLKEIGDHLVDLHGPHDHQMLFSEESHIDILDRLSALETVKQDYTEKYIVYLDLNKKLGNLQTLALSRDREQDLLGHQIKELEQVKLDNDAYEKLLAERTRINNAENLYECAAQLLTILENEQAGISTNISKAFTPMNTLNSIDDTTQSLAESLSRLQEESSELLSTLNNYVESLSFEPERSHEINKQYDIYYDILRKYGPAIEDAATFYLSAKEKYDLLADLEHNDLELKKQIASTIMNLSIVASKLTEKRKKTAKSLRITIENELKELGIANVRFECQIKKSELNKNGADKIALYISPNAGEELKPLAEIVSSGEASRIMLALKKALTKVDPIPVLIFDEIDAQIGGRLGSITGRKLKELSKDRQVILITHLPQIAAFGDYHLHVSKKVETGRTLTNITFLDEDARITELAKMMSGEKQSEIALKHAKDMLDEAERLE
ncbi:MAG: DNA repair protein RecN [Candidatus Omnitrophota bacterium]